MKKILLGSSALVVAAGVASAVSAAEWQTGVGGYMHAGVALVDNDKIKNDGVGILRDGEVYLNAKLIADNGITFGTVVQLEAWSQGGDQIDENILFVEGSFGRVEFGGNDSAGYQMVGSLAAFSAAGAHLGYFDSFGVTQAGKNAGVIAGNRDSVGIHYYTPRFYGFQAGASYIPDTAADGAGDTNNFSFDNGFESWSAAVNYVGDFGDFGVDLGFSYWDAEGKTAGRKAKYGVAGGVSYAGFGVRGFYEDDEGDEWGVGAQYKTGPWTFAGGYADYNTTNAEILTGWVSYAAAPGVTLSTGIEYATVDNDGRGGDLGGAALISLSF